MVKKQIQGYLLGCLCFCLFTALDYNKFREWTWLLYLLMLLSLLGLFFTNPIARVHRWYRLPFLPFNFQPSELAKLVVIISLSWFLERRQENSSNWSTALIALLIMAFPFLLILKQPDLGTALVLFPITWVIFYFGGVHPWVIKTMGIFLTIALLFVGLIFLEIVPHETLRPYVKGFLKEYQFDRLDPHTHHQKASTTAIALGGIVGKGWRKSLYTGGGWLPAPYTDSVFPAFGEEFGLIGLLLLLFLFYALIYLGLEVVRVANNLFGRLLAAGLTMYLAIHMFVNVGMMTALLPITGVPLVLVSYGGSSIVATMIALGILQSIYSRRFMF